ncbi:hypothetical protein SUDANB145_07348 (plasmid) [Streptomyces sp. enrichment culture]
MSSTKFPAPGVTSGSAVPGGALDAEARVRELIAVLDSGEALTQAAELATAACLPHELLLHLWPSAADPDGFCAALLAPAMPAACRGCHQPVPDLRDVAARPAPPHDAAQPHRLTLQGDHRHHRPGRADRLGRTRPQRLRRHPRPHPARRPDLADQPHPAPLPRGRGHPAAADPEEPAPPGPEHDQGAQCRRVRRGLSPAGGTQLPGLPLLPGRGPARRPRGTHRAEPRLDRHPRPGRQQDPHSRASSAAND